MRPSSPVTEGRPGGDGARDLGLRDNPSVPLRAANPYRVQAGRFGVAARADKTVWVLTLAAAALGSGAFGRARLGDAQEGLVPWLLLAGAVTVLALPLLLGEAALGQFRRRNAVDAFGPGPWSGAGWLAAVACIPLAALLAYAAAIAARLAYDSFQGGFFDDPDRHWRLVTQGWDALVLTLGALLVAAGVAASGARRGLRGTMTAVAVVGLLAIAALALYALVAAGQDGRDAAFALDADAFSARAVVAALQQSLVPAFLGFGLVATMSGHVHDRTLPREGVFLAMLWLLATLAAGATLAALGQQEGIGLDGPGLQGAVRIFAAIGGTAGGLLAGTFFGVLLAGSLAALVAVLEVPATFVHERVAGFGEARANLGAALVAYLAAVPLAFVRPAASDLGLVLTAVVAPLGGLLVALHVGWARPEVLDGFVVGDAKHRLDRLLRPLLRYILPLALLALLVLGSMQVAAEVFGASAGSGGLWSLVP